MTQFLARDPRQQLLDHPVQAAALALRSARAARRPIAPISVQLRHCRTRRRLCGGRGQHAGAHRRGTASGRQEGRPDLAQRAAAARRRSAGLRRAVRRHGVPQRRERADAASDAAQGRGRGGLRGGRGPVLRGPELGAVPVRDRLCAAGHRDRRQRHRRLEDQPGRHRGGQRLVRPVRARRSAGGARCAVARRSGHAHVA